MRIRDITSRLIKECGTNNPFEIAAQKKIVVLFEPLGKTLGYANQYNRIQLIHINDSLPEEEAVFVCGHELGHRILHPGLNTPFLRANTFFSLDRIEREAHEFSMHLLIGTDALRPGETVTELLWRNNVPIGMEKYYRILANPPADGDSRGSN